MCLPTGYHVASYPGSLGGEEDGCYEWILAVNSEVSYLSNCTISLFRYLGLKPATFLI